MTKKGVKILSFRESKTYEQRSDVMLINTTSRATDWGKGFSPFTLGPVALYDDYVAKNVENAWQFSKVYPEHVNEKQEPTKAYFDWAKKGWEDSYAHRYPMGKGKAPLFSYWKGEKLDYIAARKRIYAPLYAKAVVNTPAFYRLLTMYEEGDEFALVDFDGYDYLSLGMTLKEVIDEPKRKMGHAFVLAMLLEYPKFREKAGMK